MGKPVAVIERDARVEPGRDVRGPGLWLTITEESLGHWSVGFEAFGLELDDPDDVFGLPIPVGLDLEWEDDPTAEDCRVTGEVLVGDAVIAVDGRGRRETSA
ncbi:MAG TPA: hypothetical protein VM262_13430 [Acidimicrobiales bacterium]|nr:hypothetical protein [Acidimicrobiales bacterium]